MPESKSAPPLVVPNPAAPDIFADELVSLERVNGTIRFHHAVLRRDPSAAGPRRRVEACTIILPEAAAQRLCLALYDFLNKQGLDPAKMVRSGEVAQ